MTQPQVRNHVLGETTLTWEQVMVHVPVIAVDDVAAALHVNRDVLVKDYLHSGDYHTIWSDGAGRDSMEFDSLWDYLQKECPFEGAQELWTVLFGCEL